MSYEQDAATLCYGLYRYPDSPNIAWDYLDDGTNSGGVYWAMVRYNGLLWVVYRGSVTKQDWVRDFYAFDDPFVHSALGPIHPGMYQGLPVTIQKVLSFASPNEPIGVTGHSLGAGRATLATGLLVVAKRPPAARIVFGEPHTGRTQLANLFLNVPGPSFRNTGGPRSDWDHIDQVTMVPPWFATPTARTDNTVAPIPNDPWGPFRYHHMSLYAAATGIQQTYAY